MTIILLIICFWASCIGAICGIGGGVIIKPLVDSLGILSVSAISFLSGCTVLAMTCYSVIKSRLSGQSSINKKVSFPLAIGAVIGGIVGKILFQYVSKLVENENGVGTIQSIALLLVTAGTFVYTIRKNDIHTHTIDNCIACGTIGIVLGIMSVFLGIGGGPINLVVLYYFFSMKTKTAAENSLYLIFFSQLSSLLFALGTKSVPQIQPSLVLFMSLGGILGGICGRAINQKISEKNVDMLFKALMVAIMLLNILNILKFQNI